MDKIEKVILIGYGGCALMFANFLYGWFTARGSNGLNLLLCIVCGFFLVLLNMLKEGFEEERSRIMERIYQLEDQIKYLKNK